MNWPTTVQMVGIWLIAAALTCLGGCERKVESSGAPASAGSRLAASLVSGQSPEQVRAQLDRSGWRDWRVVDQPEAKPPAGRPDFRFLSAEADGESLGVKGKLRVDFLNDRLMATWFFPNDTTAYRAAIQKLPATDPLKQANFGVDYRNQNYALWEDPRLRKEMEDWIRKHS